MRILLLLLPLLLGADFPIKYPKETLQMSKAQFYNWAVDQNKQAQKKWTKEFNEGYQYNYGSRETETTNTYGFNSGKSVITPLSVSNDPNTFSTTVKKQKRKTYYRYKNPDFRHPGPLTIINPFVRPKKQ